MEYFIVPLFALLASLLTFFSGFGLGTLLMPILAIFFPIQEAILLTAIVHLLNNIFKLALVAKNIDRSLLLSFGLFAMLGAWLGSSVLAKWIPHQILYQYNLGNIHAEITVLKIAIAGLMVFFTLFDIVPSLKKIEFKKDFVVLGGLISGFFGGLTGHQGALRSAFLVRFSLPKEVFIATGTAIACCIDVIRVPVYLLNSELLFTKSQLLLLGITTLAAFSGAFWGNKLLKKTTMNGVKNAVSLLLFAIALLIGIGLL
jgi:uncharacterized protein